MYSLSRFRRPDARRLAALSLVSIVISGCSMPMGALIGGGDDKPEVTGTAAPADGRATASAQASGSVQLATAQPLATNPLSPTDWTYARGALGLALTSTQSGPPVPWANPETGTRGNFAPSAEAVTADGRTCRSFVATRTENGREVQLNGRACRTADGQWDISETSKTAL
jgi:surface antigen